MQECKAACIKLNIGRVMPLEFDSHSPIHTHGPMAAMQGTHPTHEEGLRVPSESFLSSCSRQEINSCSKVILKWLPQPSTPYCTVKDTISLSFVLQLLLSMFWYLVYLTTSKKMPNDCCSHPRPLTINQLSEASSLCSLWQWVSFFVFLAPKNSGFSTLCHFTRKSFCSYHGAYMFE